MKSCQTTTYPGMHVTIPNPYAPTSSMALHPQPPLGFLNTGNQVQTGQLSYITSPGILTTLQLGLENVPTGHPAPGTTATNPKFKDAAMALGVIHIITGLMHIGFGIVLGMLSINYHMSWAFCSVAFIGGYPFWGGLSFIASGSLSISAFKKPSPSLLKSTLATNIISVIFASVGLILFVWDLNTNGYYYQNYWMVLSGTGIVGVLAIFSLLEVSIACATVHFAYQTLLLGKRSALAVPTVHVANPLTQQPFPDPAIEERVPAYAPQPYPA
ncbi:membrane-spanning 4-domains subfamily A member 12 [Microtus ochrogaster]|uniref:Membrane-spanning 4-domains subfamily A member 12 n=1 Tax=Microtus ochrogaster TaxID=79684 RepID=A0ABM0LNN4_MICOH|nr:membrane-spanning 4-domains subfamily A member 12 [Microtus ochrogaster]